MSNTSKAEQLHSAIRTGRYEKVIQLIENGADVNYKDSFSNDALYYAVAHCKVDITGYLLKHGANINSVYSEGKNILHITVEAECEDKGFFNIVKLLVSNGVDLNRKDDFGNTPLWYACIYYVINNETIRYLLNNKADINIVNKFGLSSLTAAKKRGESDLVALLEGGSNVSK